MNFLNNTFVTLEAPVASSDRVIFAKKFIGNLGENFPLSAVLQESDSAGTIIKREIIRITGKNDTMLNVERAVEPCPQSDAAERPSQNPLNFSENAVIIHTLTAGDLGKILGKFGDIRKIPDIRGQNRRPIDYAAQTFYGPEFVEGATVGLSEAWWINLHTYSSWTVDDFNYKTQLAITSQGPVLGMWIRRAVDNNTWGTWERVHPGISQDEIVAKMDEVSGVQYLEGNVQENIPNVWTPVMYNPEDTMAIDIVFKSSESNTFSPSELIAELGISTPFSIESVIVKQDGSQARAVYGVNVNLVGGGSAEYPFSWNGNTNNHLSNSLNVTYFSIRNKAIQYNSTEELIVRIRVNKPRGFYIFRNLGENLPLAGFLKNQGTGTQVKIKHYKYSQVFRLDSSISNGKYLVFGAKYKPAKLSQQATGGYNLIVQNVGEVFNGFLYK